MTSVGLPDELHAIQSCVRWQDGLRNAIRSSVELAEMLQLDMPHESLSNGLSNDFGFPLFVTREFASRIRRGDWNDPLLQQVWVDQRESNVVPGYVSDPVGDREAEIAPGLLQKYHGRVLLISTGACAIHCRYCFRRHYPYSTAPKTLRDWQPALDRIAADPSIKEVILSGGDPLTIVDSTLALLVDKLDQIDHLERLRIHTRLPIVLPQRVDSKLLEWLSGTRLSKWVVLHTNHSQEIDDHVVDAISKLRTTGANLLNQAVLLRGINDTTEAQESLCKKLLQVSVLPYYLNQLDLVNGAAHFKTDIEVGRRIVHELSTRLPGYGVPRFVQEQSGKPNKIRID